MNKDHKEFTIAACNENSDSGALDRWQGLDGSNKSSMSLGPTMMRMRHLA